MPRRLRPTASFAPDAILVGDPGRALLLAQELLEQPKMSNHARGLWGYSGTTPAGAALTIQSTGIGGPSAGAVLADLAKLGVRRAVRIGTAVGSAATSPGTLLIVERAVSDGGSAAAFGLAAGEGAAPDPSLQAALAVRLGGEARPGAVASVDTVPAPGQALADGIEAADMQTAALLARAAQLGIAAAALLVVVEGEDSEPLDDDQRDEAMKRAGRAASAVLSPSS
jgi:uridine phosphorylase